jgi:hypothetical protein
VLERVAVSVDKKEKDGCASKVKGTMPIRSVLTSVFRLPTSDETTTPSSFLLGPWQALGQTASPHKLFMSMV